MNMAHQLGMEVLLEMHNERDFEYAELEPDMYGINNRNLGTFRYGCGEQFPIGRETSEGCVQGEREWNLQPADGSPIKRRGRLQWLPDG